jgi:large conductance mechanosensitive channel
MWKEFKEFAIKGNVIDLAIGVIIGTAFGKIVTSLVNDLLMPILGLLSGGIDLNDLSYAYGETEIRYGAFLQSIVDFLIISVSIFFFVKALSRLKLNKKEEPAPEPPKPSQEEALLAEIRDLLKEQVSGTP